MREAYQLNQAILSAVAAEIERRRREINPESWRAVPDSCWRDCAAAAIDEFCRCINVPLKSIMQLAASSPPTTGDRTASWPDTHRPGYPVNSNTSGWHWAISYKNTEPCVYFWNATLATFDQHSPAGAAARYTYLGPCLTPSESARQLAAARQEALKKAAQAVRGGKEVRSTRYHDCTEVVDWNNMDEAADAILALVEMNDANNAADCFFWCARSPNRSRPLPRLGVSHGPCSHSRRARPQLLDWPRWCSTVCLESLRRRDDPPART